MAPLKQPGSDLENLYHVVLISSNIKHDPTPEIQHVRVCGTFTSLKAAKAVAHSCLFDLGYEREWFSKFDTHHASHADASAAANGDTAWPYRDGVIVHAVAPDGDTFEVRIDTTLNSHGWREDEDDETKPGTTPMPTPLYYVLQTTIFYEKDAGGLGRESNVVEACDTEQQARMMAQRLLTPGGKADAQSGDWELYETLPASENDWEHGENVVVHAVGKGGENILMSVLKEQELEPVRVGRAAARMR